MCKHANMHTGACVFTLCAVWTSGLLAAVGINDPADRLPLLEAAQETLRAAYPRGRLKARATANYHRGASTETVTSTVIWDGDRTYWDYEKHEVVKKEDKVDFRSWGEIIDDGTSYFFLRRGSEPISTTLLSIDLRRSQSSIGTTYAVRPDLAWVRDPFLFEFSMFVDAAHILRDFGGDYRGTVTVREDGDDRVVVEFEFLGTPDTPDENFTRLVASREADWNIVSATTDGRTIGRRNEVSLEWDRDPKGRVFLKNLQATQSGGKNNQYEAAFQLSTLEFDPDFAVPKDRFVSTTLRIPPGTNVREYDGDKLRQYKWGETTIDALRARQERLDELAVSLANDGFASGQRDDQ